jgi:hypothetical protein
VRFFRDRGIGESAMQDNEGTRSIKKAVLWVAISALTALDVWLGVSTVTTKEHTVTVYRDTGRPVTVRL